MAQPLMKLVTEPAAGIFSGRMLREAVENGVIRAAEPVLPGQVQPASLDLRLGRRGWRMRASFLPGAGRSVAEGIATLQLHAFDLSPGFVLETGCVYLVELAEALALPPDLAAAANPKSSTGRLDVFTRVVTDGGQSFDLVPAGYHGPLYAEISPRTFPVLVRTGSRLSQLRIRRGSARLEDAALAALHAVSPVTSDREASIGGGIALSVDLSGEAGGGTVGYRARKHTGVVDVDRVGAYQAAAFWDRLEATSDHTLILDPGEFYILASKEEVRVPPDYAAEMVPFDALVGEFRVHYAGFFDPGFGDAGAGARAVLEVRSRDVPFIIGHGQTVGRLVYEHMAERPETIYGQGLGSNYQGQALKLSKHFL